MKRKFGGVVLVAAMAAFASSVDVRARPGRRQRRQAPGARGVLEAAEADVAVARHNSISRRRRRPRDATEAAAVAAKAKVAIAVVDANGDLVYFRRMDGTAGIPVTASQAKARAAILFGVPTKSLQDAVAAGTPSPPL